jgi:oxygen-independent coproporphyrinogen III oxidase
MIALYLHIPFCERKCLYCDFYSVEEKADVPAFVDALIREIDLRSRLVPDRAVDTIYFGGGTPSLLVPDQVEKVLSHLRSAFSVSPSAEITLEANPGTVDNRSLPGFRRAGINRLSVGIQSFADADLRFLGRIHDSSEAHESFRTARSAGFDNLSLDLIYAIPGQTLQSWQTTLDMAIGLHPEHISAYNLIVEEGTPLHRLVGAGVVTPRSSDEEALFYERTMQTLEAAGFEHYEVSNYARCGYRSRHNTAYWNHSNYLGFGPSAHSFWCEAGAHVARRWWSSGDVRGYVDALEGGCLPDGAEESLGVRELVNESIFLGLRSTGVDLQRLKTEFGFEMSKESREVLAASLVEGYMQMHEGVFRLTSKGFQICDEIAARLMIP